MMLLLMLSEIVPLAPVTNYPLVLFTFEFLNLFYEHSFVFDMREISNKFIEL